MLNKLLAAAAAFLIGVIPALAGSSGGQQAGGGGGGGGITEYGIFVPMSVPGNAAIMDGEVEIAVPVSKAGVVTAVKVIVSASPVADTARIQVLKVDSMVNSVNITADPAGEDITALTDYIPGTLALTGTLADRTLAAGESIVVHYSQTNSTTPASELGVIIEFQPN